MKGPPLSEILGIVSHLLYYTLPDEMVNRPTSQVVDRTVRQIQKGSNWGWNPLPLEKMYMGYGKRGVRKGTCILFS